MYTYKINRKKKLDIPLVSVNLQQSHQKQRSQFSSMPFFHQFYDLGQRDRWQLEEECVPYMVLDHILVSLEMRICCVAVI